METVEEKVNHQAAVVAAADLIKQTAEATATSLNIQYIQRDILEIKQGQKDAAKTLQGALENMTKRDEKFVLKDDFVWWRNLIVSGMLLTVFIGVVFGFINK